MTRVSLCMIVRDEAALLPEFLSHIGGVCDQFVAVDTGSVDATPRLLEDAGAEVHCTEWRDDFAVARNISLSHATGDWILVLDADEFPHEGFADELRALVARQEVGAANITRHDEQRNGIVRVSTPLRLFRNGPHIRYRYRIHEDASESVIAAMRLGGTRLTQMETPVRHVGYAMARLEDGKKRIRDERLLRLALDDDPEDLYSRYKLLELYRFWAERDAAHAVARDCLRLLKKGRTIHPPHVAGDLVDMLRVSVCGEDAAAGLAFLEEMAAVAAQTGQYHLAAGMLQERMGQLEAAFRCFTAALERLEGDPVRLLIETRALTGLARLSLAIGDGDSAGAFAEAALALSPDDPEARLFMQAVGRP